MPSPIGHALGGIAAAWTADLVPGARAWRVPDGRRLTLVCGALGAAADLDLLVGGHRTVTHSVGAVFVVVLFAAAMALKARRPVVRIALMCAGAYATHLLLDWLAVDPNPPYGITLLWPFSDRWFISGLDLFLPTERRIPTLPWSEVVGVNARAIARELLMLGPIVAALGLVRVKALAGLAPQVSRRHHAAQ